MYQHLISMLLISFIMCTHLQAQEPIRLESCINGRIKAADTGEPVSNVRIRSFTEDHAWNGDTWFSETASDSNGEYEIQAIGDPGYNSDWEFILAFDKPGYFMTTQYVDDIKPFQPCHEFNVELQKCIPVQGNVTDDQGIPLEDVLIEVVPSRFGYVVASARPPRPTIYFDPVRTDEKGTYTISSPVYPDQYHFRFSKQGYATVFKSLYIDHPNKDKTLSEDQKAKFPTDITMYPAAKPLTVNVTDENDEPIEGLHMFASYPGFPFIFEQDVLSSAVTNQKGLAVFDTLGDDTYDIFSFVHPINISAVKQYTNFEGDPILANENSKHTTVTLSNEYETYIELPLPEPQIFSGTVTFPIKEPDAPRATITSGVYQGGEDFLHTQTTQTDEEGNFELKTFPGRNDLIYYKFNLPEGYYEHSYKTNSKLLSHWPGTSKHQRPFYITAIQYNTLNLTLPKKTVLNEVLDLQLIPYFDESSAELPENYQYISKSHGPVKFINHKPLIEKVIPSTYYEIRAFGEEICVNQSFHTGPVGNNLEVELEFLNYGQIECIVLLDGEPVPDADVSITDISERKHTFQSKPYTNNLLRTDQNGKLLAPKVLPTEQLVSVYFREKDDRRRYTYRDKKQVIVRENELTTVEFEFEKE